MKKWLRSEPINLPFTEVWDDLIQLLGARESFETIAKKRPFVARISQDPLSIEIVAARRRYYIQYETLVAFWQQLRTHGFSMPHIAPGLDRQMSYLISIFAELEYITPVHVADRYDRLQNAVVTGLQVLPSAFVREPLPFTQLSLF